MGGRTCKNTIPPPREVERNLGMEEAVDRSLHQRDYDNILSRLLFYQPTFRDFFSIPGSVWGHGDHHFTLSCFIMIFFGVLLLPTKHRQCCIDFFWILLKGIYHHFCNSSCVQAHDTFILCLNLKFMLKKSFLKLLQSGKVTLDCQI